MKFKLRTKLMVFAALIAALPLIVAGQSIIRVAQDELKSSANEQLGVTVQQVVEEFNAFFEYSIFTSLDLIRNAIGGNTLNFEAKIAILRQGIADLPDIVSLQVGVESAPRPIVVMQESYFARLKEQVEEPLNLLRVDQDKLPDGDTPERERAARSTVFLKETQDWIATATLDVPGGIGGRPAIMHSRINLERMRSYIAAHPFAKTGAIHVIDTEGRIVFSTTKGEYDRDIIREAAVEILRSDTATVTIKPFELDTGDISLVAIAETRAFPFAIIVEKDEKDAYQTVTDMIQNLAAWLGAGIAAALLGALMFALTISRPILKIGQSAKEIAQGNLDTRVTGVKSHDEIGDLATQFNEMILQLNERFELQKFVSAGTMKAISDNEERQVSLGGDRQRVAMLFADIRGYTAFSENRAPEEVVDVLNDYFQRLSDIVVKHHGDIDKFVGDQIMAVFTGNEMEVHAVNCAIDIMKAIEHMATGSTAQLKIGIGIDVGDVVVGAMGSDHRKDFTVLGDHVNTAARLCSAAAPDQTLISAATFERISQELATLAEKERPLDVKGKSQSLEVYAINLKTLLV